MENTPQPGLLWYPRPVTRLQEVWLGNTNCLIQNVNLIHYPLNVYLSSPTIPLFNPPFVSAPGVLPVPDGSGRSGHRLNKITSLKYPEDPGMVFFLGLFSPLNLNKGG